MIQLRRPTLDDKASIFEMIDDFERHNSAHDGGFWNSDDFQYEDWLKTNQEAELGFNIPEGWVPSIQFVAFFGNKAIGFLNLRLRLNDHLLAHGGHIGYSVRPSERGNGYAKDMLKQGILEAQSKNINEILVTCHQSNAASRAIILANGGILENTLDETERYWINPVSR